METDHDDNILLEFEDTFPSVVPIPEPRELHPSTATRKPLHESVWIILVCDNHTEPYEDYI